MYALVSRLQSCRTAFLGKALIFNENGTWHKLSTCLWECSFTLTDYLNVSTSYPDLEDFFVRRLRVKKADPSMLIDEVRRMVVRAKPNIADIRMRLIEIGMMMTKSSVDLSMHASLDALQEIAFLPKSLADGTSVLVSTTDDFAISDHQRYGDALGGYGVLLDFRVEEVQILHSLFVYLDLADRYLSVIVEEVSTVGADSVTNDELSEQLRAKAYALYW